MTPSEVMALAALIVAVVAIPITILATRRWGNRRAVLSYAVEVTPLLPEADQARDLAVTYLDFAVPEPKLVTLTLTNSGPRDITSDSFDSGQPVRVLFTGTFYGVTATSGGPILVMPAIGAEGDDGAVEFHPKLMKRRESWSASLIVGGAVEVSVDAPLAHTDLKAVSAKNAEFQWALMLAMIEAMPLPGSRGVRSVVEVLSNRSK